MIRYAVQSRFFKKTNAIWCDEFWSEDKNEILWLFSQCKGINLEYRIIKRTIVDKIIPIIDCPYCNYHPGLWYFDANGEWGKCPHCKGREVIYG